MFVDYLSKQQGHYKNATVTLLVIANISKHKDLLWKGHINKLW